MLIHGCGEDKGVDGDTGKLWGCKPALSSTGSGVADCISAVDGSCYQICVADLLTGVARLRYLRLSKA